MDDVTGAYRPHAAVEATCFRVDDLIVDLGRQRVMRAGVDLKLPRLSFDLFVALVRAAPNVVTVSRLTDIVWPDTVVNPETVSQRIKLLRSALGDDAKSARYVGGVRNRGYRIAPPSSSSVRRGPRSIPRRQEPRAAR
jgi:DNA-binding winged helix-turn-helix (wHTH) protein